MWYVDVGMKDDDDSSYVIPDQIRASDQTKNDSDPEHVSDMSEPEMINLTPTNGGNVKLMAMPIISH